MSLLGLGIAAGIGGAAGALEGWGNFSAKRNARNMLKKGRENADSQYDALIAAMSGEAGQYGDTADQYLARMQSKMDAQSPTYAAGQFKAEDVNALTQKLMNPAMAQVNASTQKAMENASAARGNLLSGAAQKAIAERIAENTSKEWNAARSAALQQIGQDLSAFNANEAARQQEAAQAQSAKQYDINTLLGIYNTNLAQKSAATQSATNLGVGKIAADTQYYRDRAGLGNTSPAASIVAGSMSGITPFIGQIPKLL